MVVFYGAIKEPEGNNTTYCMVHFFDHTILRFLSFQNDQELLNKSPLRLSDAGTPPTNLAYEIT